jgi:hypothetical protein
MKKRYFTYAGIASAAILIAMFVMVFYTKSPLLFLIPVITVDPVTGLNLDDNNYLILTGKTNLEPRTVLSLDLISAGTVLPGDRNATRPVAKGDVWITGNREGWYTWSGTINLSPLEPGEYQGVLKAISFEDNYTKKTEIGPLASFIVQLGDGSCTSGCLRKKEIRNRPYIRINPATEDGNQIRFTGTTNLPPGRELGWEVWRPESLASGNQNYHGVTNVTQGLEGVNRWSVTPDPGFLIPEDYRLTVTSLAGVKAPGPSPEMVSATRVFNRTLHPAEPGIQGTLGLKSGPSEYLTIDALPDMKVNGKYVITGTTNLPPGEELFFEISPPRMRNNYNFTINPKDRSEQGFFSGIAGCMRVENGSGEENLWAVDAETYVMPPGTYEIQVSNMTRETGAIPIKPGSVLQSGIFDLHGAA